MFSCSEIDDEFVVGIRKVSRSSIPAVDRNEKIRSVGAAEDEVKQTVQVLWLCGLMVQSTRHATITPADCTGA